MKEKNPIEPMIEQILEILALFETYKTKKLEGDATPEELVMLANIELQVAAAKEAYLIALEREGLKQEDVFALLHQPEKMPKADQKILMRLRRIGRDVQTIHLALDRAVNEQQRSVAKTGKPLHKKRKKGSNLGIGFRKGWNRL